MKKTFLTLSLATFFVFAQTSCGGNKEEKTASVETTPATADNVATDSGSDVPTFSDESVTKFCKDYKAALDETVTAYKNKDMTKIKDMQTKYMDLSKQGATLAGKIKMDEMQKYGDFMSKISTEYAKAIQESVK
jgi:cell wall assembly regulator SMI1